MNPPQKEGHQDSVVPNIVQGERDERDIPAGFTLQPNGHFRCNVCEVVCNSLVSATKHVRGQKHRRTVASNQDSMVPNGVPAGFTQEANASLRCMVCKVCCSSVKVVEVHIVGKRHRLQSMLLALKTNK